MRQKCKQILTITAVLGAVALLISPSAVVAQGLVETVVTNPLTGVAIDGFDPVSYFVDGAPRQGSPEYAHEWQGVTWYFSSAANRDVFLRHPEIYAPQYGGHCAMSMARGYLSDGNPRLYAVSGVKLYMFYSVANREAFFQSVKSSVAAAETEWKLLSPKLVGPQAPIAGTLGGGSEPDAVAASALVPAKQ